MSMTHLGLKLSALSMCLLVSAASILGQTQPKPLTNDDVLKMVKAGLANDTIFLTISHSKTAFDTSPDEIIKLNQGGVPGPVLNAMLNVSSGPTVAAQRQISAGSDAPCPDKRGVYFTDGGGWVPLLQAASAGSQVKPVFGGAKSSVIYIGSDAPVTTTSNPRFCFREIKPDLGITVVKLDQKKDHRELQTSL